MTKEELREKANDLPLLPGVYLMMDKTGKVIYVGKAKKLKNRVSQYFQDTASHNEKTRAMVSQVDHFDTIFVSSEFEAKMVSKWKTPSSSATSPDTTSCSRTTRDIPSSGWTPGPPTPGSLWRERRRRTAPGTSAPSVAAGRHALPSRRCAGR